MKRRRLNDSSSVLSKPFKSPLVTRPHRDEAGGENSQREAPDPVQPLTAQSSPVQDSTVTTPPRPGEVRRPPPSSPNPLVHSMLRDPDVITLQKQHSALLLQLSQLKRQLDTAEQAVKLSKSNQDEALQALVTKWKYTSREAAEEVFRGAKEKINRMGGVGAWRERSNRKPQGWDDEEEVNQEELTEEQKEAFEVMREEAAEEARIYGSVEKEEQGNDDDVVYPFQVW